MRLINSNVRMRRKGAGTGFACGVWPLQVGAFAVIMAVSVAAGQVGSREVKLWPDGAPGAKGTPTRKNEEREAVGQRDPGLEKRLQTIWGKPKATIDTPWAERN